MSFPLMLFDSLCVLELVVDALVSQNVQDLALPTHCQPALLPGLDYHFTIFFFLGAAGVG